MIFFSNLDKQRVLDNKNKLDFNPKDQIFRFHLSPFGSKSFYQNSLKRPVKDWEDITSVGNSKNKRSHFRVFLWFSQTFKCISEAHFLTYLKARDLIWKIKMYATQKMLIWSQKDMLCSKNVFEKSVYFIFMKWGKCLWTSV